jgi:hypothetical protein
LGLSPKLDGKRQWVCRVRVRIAEWLLVVAAIVVTCLVAEVVFTLVGLHYVPLRLHSDLPQDVRTFAQSSKARVVPVDPVLLLGDSYAQGKGEWLLEADPNRNGPFHSAHVIQSLSGRDVVTLGRSGAGSAEGMVALPATAYTESKQAWYLRLPRPRVAFVYFYEGNDLNNNAGFLMRRVDSLDTADLVERIDRALAEYPSAFVRNKHWLENFSLLYFLQRIVRRRIKELLSSESTQRLKPHVAIHPQENQPNVVEVAGRTVELPANLQSPSLDMTHPKLVQAALVFERSLAFLRKLLPDTKINVVYVPAPLSIYKLISPEVSIRRYVIDRPKVYPSGRVAEYSNAICRLIRAAAVNHDAGFLDLRPAMRAASARNIVHGPRDFEHFNKVGMEVLGQAVAERLDRPLLQDSC